MALVPRIHTVTTVTPAPDRSKLAQTQGSPEGLDACAARWAPTMQGLKNTPWSQCPPALTADFVRALMNDLEADYPEDLTYMAGQMAATSFMESAHPTFTFELPWAQAQLRLRMAWANTPTLVQDDEETALEVGIDMPEGSTPEDTQEALDHWLAQDTTDLTQLSVRKQLPDTAFLALLAQVEALTPQARSMELLMAAAGLVLLWDRQQRINGDTYVVRLSGVTVSGVEPRPGQDAVGTSTIEPWTPTVEPDAPTGRGARPR